MFERFLEKLSVGFIILLIVLVILLIGLVWCPSVFSAEKIPAWADKELKLRGQIKDEIDRTMNFQYSDGRIWKFPSKQQDDISEIMFDWMSYYNLTGDERVFQQCKKLALWYLKYWKAGVVVSGWPNGVHDTEHTGEGITLLGDLLYARPDDPEIREAVRDIIEHASNQALVGEWYYPATKHLLNVKLYTIGTTNIIYGSIGVDWSFNLIFAKLALSYFNATNDSSYLNWACDYLGGWIATIERNERENKYYIIPSEVDPITGKIGKWSGAWWKLKYDNNWSWDVNGITSHRDMSVFLDAYQLSGQYKYLDCLKKQLKTLFKNGKNGVPAEKFDGKRWLYGNNGTTARLAIETALLDSTGELDPLIAKWPYSYTMNYMWRWIVKGDMNALILALNTEITTTTKQSAALKVLKKLPSKPDDFPHTRGMLTLSMATIGSYSNRAMKPWSMVTYFHFDSEGGLLYGLEDGIAVLVAKNGNELWFWNNNSVAKYIGISQKGGIIICDELPLKALKIIILKNKEDYQK